MADHDRSSSANDTAETDERFPSGEWTGFFLQPPAERRIWMDLVLAFGGGRVDGSGDDSVGPFSIRGTYDVDTGDVSLRKQYVGAHAVDYHGYAEHEHGIWGVWNILRFTPGGFHLWPRSLGDATAQRAEKQEPVDTAIRHARTEESFSVNASPMGTG